MKSKLQISAAKRAKLTPASGLIARPAPQSHHDWGHAAPIGYRHNCEEIRYAVLPRSLVLLLHVTILRQRIYSHLESFWSAARKYMMFKKVRAAVVAIVALFLISGSSVVQAAENLVLN